MPGTDPLTAARTVFDELPELPHLPELPGRGPGADLIGRAAALLTDLPVELTPAGWRLAGRPGRDLRRARDYLTHDLDTLEEVAQGWTGPLKVQVCGPWTLAAALELPASQEPALTDRGAVADLVASLAEGVAAHVKEVASRIPGADVLLQLDEPGLPAVLDGAIPSASGWRRLAPVEEGPATDGLRTLIAAAGVPAIVHCCAAHPPFGLFREAGAAAVAVDLSLLAGQDEDAFAETVEAGLGILAGVIQATPATRPSGGAAGRPQGSAETRPPGSTATRSPGSAGARPRDGAATGPQAEGLARLITGRWQRIGLPLGPVTRQVVVTPACGLAGATPERAAAVLAACHEAARILPELIEEETA